MLPISETHLLAGWLGRLASPRKAAASSPILASVDLGQPLTV
jgi:hypothetical protein